MLANSVSLRIIGTATAHMLGEVLQLRDGWQGEEYIGSVIQRLTHQSMAVLAPVIADAADGRTADYTTGRVGQRTPRILRCK